MQRLRQKDYQLSETESASPPIPPLPESLLTSFSIPAPIARRSFTTSPFLMRRMREGSDGVRNRQSAHRASAAHAGQQSFCAPMRATAILISRVDAAHQHA